MKRCPKCNAGYFDNMLEYCLEDGTKLVFSSSGTAVDTQKNAETETPGQVPGRLSVKPSEETVVIETNKQKAASVSGAADQSGSAKLIEFSPIVLALLHNWWQWVYLEKVYVYSWTDYLLSANFLMWLLLLGAGIGAGVYSVKRLPNRAFGIVGLVTLAINLILFLVPRK